MKKVVFILYILFCVSAYAQDSIVENQDIITSEATKTDSVGQHFSEKDIVVDNEVVKIKKFKSNLKKKYNSEDFDYTEKIKEKGLWERFQEWLARWLQKIFSMSSKDSSMQAANIVVKVISTLIILYVIYIIAKLILNQEGNWIFGSESNKKIIHHEDIERNLRNVDFEKLIKEILKSDDKRLAIRYYYLWLLKKLAEKNIIELNPDKTNTDYLYEIKNEQIKKDFNYASYLYDYIWYGEFNIDNTNFEQIKSTFENIIKSVY